MDDITPTTGPAKASREIYSVVKRFNGKEFLVTDVMNNTDFHREVVKKYLQRLVRLNRLCYDEETTLYEEKKINE